MKKIIILALAAIALSIGCYTIIEDSSIEQIVDVLETGDGRLMVLQKEANDQLVENLTNYLKPSYQLLIADTKGQVLQEVKLPKDKRSTFSEYDNLSIDAQGNRYIHRVQKNSDSYYVFYEEILKISPDGKTLSPIYALDYKKGGTVEYALISKAYPLGRSMYVVQRNAMDENTWEINQINLFSNVSGAIKKIQIDPELFANDLLYLSEQRIVFSTLKGELYQFKGGKLELINDVKSGDLYAPARLMPYGETSFAFFDIQTNNVMKFDLEKNTHSIIRKAADDIAKTSKLAYDNANTVYINNERSISGGMRVNNSGNRFIFLDKENLVQVISEFKGNRATQVLLFVKILGVFGTLALVIWLSFSWYRKSSGSLVVKFVALLLPMVLIIPIVSLYVSFSYFSSLAKNDLYAELYHITTERSAQIDPDALMQVNGLQDYENEAFKVLDQQRLITADDFNELNKDTYTRWYYSVMYRYIDGKLHVVTGDAASYWSTTDYTYGEKGNQTYINAVNPPQIALGENSDLTGTWVFVLAPIYDNDGQVIGLFEVGTGQQSYLYFIQSYYGKLVTLNLSIAGIVLFLVTIVIIRMIRPLRILNESVKDITEGNWGTTVSVRTQDEIGNLSLVFNNMSLFIRDYINELTKLNEIYYKFIPLKVFELMNKKSIIEVGLGDYSKQEMTIVFINTYNYFDLSKGMGSKEQLDLLNHLFEEYANAIHTHNGIVGEFRNAGLLALFTDQRDALNTAYSIVQKMKEMNKEIKSTVSIHYGEAILGVVGDENRMTTAVISNCVNEAVAIDKYAGWYNCSVLMTKAFIDSLEEPEANIRYIGDLLDEHSKETIKINEWLETVHISNQNDYFKSKNTFENALEHFMKGQYLEAKSEFIQVIKMNEHDLVSREYLFKCESALAENGQFERELGRF